MTKGNYNASTLRAELTLQLIALGYTTMVITISSITGKLTFTAVGFSFTFLFSTSTAFDILGFDITNAVSVSNVIDAPYPLNLLGIQQLRINSSAFASYNSNSTTLGESNLVGVVQSTAPPFGMILYANQTSYSILKNKNISIIDVQILDENDNLVDFNNIDWTITFQLSIFRRIKLASNSKEYLKPILETLTTIQEELQQTPPNKTDGSNQADQAIGLEATDQQAAQAAQDAQDLANQENQQQQDLQNNDANSLDIMNYNKQLPS
jgi:hypothetical protein